MLGGSKTSKLKLPILILIGFFEALFQWEIEVAS